MWRTQRVRRALLKRRDELLSRDVARSRSEADEWSSHVLTTLTERDLHELAGIIAGIHRIDEGTYGVCQHCNGGIERARLDETPAAMACGNCASFLSGQPMRAAG